jgi:hypothetical protein
MYDQQNRTAKSGCATSAAIRSWGYLEDKVANFRLRPVGTRL